MARAHGVMTGCGGTLNRRATTAAAAVGNTANTTTGLTRILARLQPVFTIRGALSILRRTKGG